MMAVKGRNAVIVAPSPAGATTTEKTVDYMRAELKKIGLPEDLVQVLPSPVNKELTQQLMNQSDLIVCTGSQNNVRRASYLRHPSYWCWRWQRSSDHRQHR